VLSSPSREIIVHIPVMMDDGTWRSLPDTGCSTRLRAVRERRLRYAPDVNLDEVARAGELDDVEVRGVNIPFAGEGRIIAIRTKCRRASWSA